jgi:Rps23 Pro-64 3,4-dihydroxylase Tpa1-like proline 4-hydroxylase
MFKVINTEVCKDREKLSHRFINATPFPHIVIDNFLHESLAEKLLAEFPDISLMHRSNHYLFTQKHELSFWANASELFSQLHQDLLSEEFRLFISQVSNVPVFMDSDFCGELHQGTNGSFLDMHVDFNLHPKQDTWIHDLTLLIYLNKNWQEDYGGQLLLQYQDNAKVYEVAPIFNRCVIMRSDETTVHGYRQLKLPTNVTRKSILVNFYRQAAINQAPARKPTIWATQKVSPLKAGLAMLYNPIATLKHRLFGLTTAGDREEVSKIKERNQNKP